jgi:uncharacterized repeat protein (TIGR03987 family)
MMSNILMISIVSMILALACYTVAVWSERAAGRLKPWHLVLFWTGFVFDTTGTTLMSKMAGGFELSMHSITGALAILLMLSHSIWATVVLVRKQEDMIRNFHKFSLVVWMIWLIPFFNGVFVGMGR